MHFQYNPYVLVYLIAAVILIFVTAYMEYKRVADRLWTVTQIFVAFWGLGFALEISGTDLKTAVFWYIVANDFAGIFSPVWWFLWAMTVAGRKHWVTRGRMALLVVLPFITVILDLTGSRHQLMYRSFWLDTSGRYPALHFSYGPWYWVILAYCAILLLGVIAIQVKAALNKELLHRKQAMIIAAATAAVAIVIALNYTVSGIFRFNQYDPTPVAISIAAVFTSLAFRFRAQEAVPVPRNAVIEKMTSAVLILDNRNRIMDLNPAAEAFLGLKTVKVAGTFFHETMRDWPELVAACLDKSVVHREFSYDGRYYDAYFSDLNDRRNAVGRLVVIQDVTANKAVETQLTQQRQALLVLQERERLARELHDSMGQVLGYTNLQIETIRELLETDRIQEADNGLNRLSQVILEANTEVREFIYEVKATLLFKNGFFDALQQYLTRFERNFQIRTEVQNPDLVTEAEIDLSAGVQLFRIIQEALANIRKHAKASIITISFQKKDREILISVADDGVGFTPASLPAGQSSFGLEVMRERAGQVGGEIRIDAAPGQGATVIVTIPRLDHSGEESLHSIPEVGTDASETHLKIRVLLVDDHVLFMEGLQNLISSKGFEIVGTARDGVEALEKARLLVPDLILMDLQMPRCNGLSATRFIKAEMPEIKIVILTMSDREQDLFEAIKNGAAGYLLKGLRAEELIDQLTGLASGAVSISPELAAQVLDEFTQKETKTAAVSESVPVEPEAVLSPRQLEVLSLVAEGYTYKEVASRLFLSERTIKYQMAEILERLHLQTRSQVIDYARRLGLGKQE